MAQSGYKYCACKYFSFCYGRIISVALVVTETLVKLQIQLNKYEKKIKEKTIYMKIETFCIILLLLYYC